MQHIDGCSYKAIIIKQSHHCMRHRYWKVVCHCLKKRFLPYHHQAPMTLVCLLDIILLLCHCVTNTIINISCLKIWFTSLSFDVDPDVKLVSACWSCCVVLFLLIFLTATLAHAFFLLLYLIMVIVNKHLLLAGFHAFDGQIGCMVLWCFPILTYRAWQLNPACWSMETLFVRWNSTCDLYPPCNHEKYPNTTNYVSSMPSEDSEPSKQIYTKTMDAFLLYESPRNQI